VDGGARVRLALRTVAALGLLLAAGAAHAGEVRVNVGVSGLNFAPYKVNINQGDHVVWVWIAGSHNVASTAPPADSTNPDGAIFDSDPGGFGQNNTTRFSWKSDRLGHVPFACVVHSPDMNGHIFIVPLTSPPTNPVADFRLSEVQFNVPGGQDLIEIANLGAAAGDLRSYRIATSASGTGVTVVNTDFPVAAGARVTIHTGAAGANTSTDIFTPGIGNLNDAAGSIALYVPSTLSSQNALTIANLMIDFVQWGAPSQANESTAGTAGFWGAGTSLNGVAAGHSIEYCANPTLDHGSNHWAEVAVPNFGSNGNCSTPVASETWGRLKIIYRR
jgi:plastocyanin